MKPTGNFSRISARKVLDYFERSGLPLYLRLAFGGGSPLEIIRRAYSLHSARRTIRHCRRAFLTAFLAEANHGRVLVKRSLGYLAAARYGLTEDEILDLLSNDDPVWKDFEERKRHTPPSRRLPGGCVVPPVSRPSPISY